MAVQINSPCLTNIVTSAVQYMDLQGFISDTVFLCDKICDKTWWNKWKRRLNAVLHPHILSAVQVGLLFSQSHEVTQISFATITVQTTIKKCDWLWMWMWTKSKDQYLKVKVISELQSELMSPHTWSHADFTASASDSDEESRCNTIKNTPSGKSRSPTLKVLPKIWIFANC